VRRYSLGTPIEEDRDRTEAVVVVVLFEDGKIAGERIYWDQTSVRASP